MPTTKAKPKVGDLVEIEFLDHCEDNGEVLPFVIFGYLIGITRAEFHVGCWMYGDRVYRGDDNERTYAIVRRAITSTRILK